MHQDFVSILNKQPLDRINVEILKNQLCHLGDASLHDAARSVDLPLAFRTASL